MLKGCKVYVNSEMLPDILESAKLLSDAVGSTMGPYGNPAMIMDDLGKTFITKDGVTVAKHTKFTNPVWNMTASIIKQAAEKTAKEAGDGTTTSTVLAYTMLDIATEFDNGNVNKIALGMKSAAEQVIKFIQDNTKPIVEVDEAVSIATISANGDETLGKMIGEVMSELGLDASITIEESLTGKDSVEIKEGMQLETGFFNPNLYSETKIELKNPISFIKYHDPLNTDDVMQALEKANKDKRDLFIAVREIDEQALNILKLNMKSLPINIGIIKIPGYGYRQADAAKDLKAFIGYETFKDGMLTYGITRVVISTKITTIYTNPYLNKPLLPSLLREIEDITPENQFEEQLLRKRKASLLGKVGIIKVGGYTESETKERYDRVEDALWATKGAIESGIVPGVGTIYLKAISVIDDNLDEDIQKGIDVIKESLSAPTRRVLTNAGVEDIDKIINLTINNPDIDIGPYITGGLVNLVDLGIIDPAKVEIEALRNAVSVASTLMMVDTVIHPDFLLSSPDLNEMM